MFGIHPSPSPTVARAIRLLHPLFLVTVLALGVVVGAWQWLLVPAEGRLAQAQADFERARQMESRVQAARVTQENLLEVWAQLPARKEFASLAEAISELAKSERVEVPGMTYTLQDVEGGLPLKGSLSFRAVGEYAAIRQYIHSLETSGSYLFIESLEAARAQGRRTAKGRHAPTLAVFTVKVVTFLRPSPAPSKGTT